MARLNISIPDALYERLDRLRDRVNASKVCAAVLEKELDMVEGLTRPVSSAEEEKVARLIDRLKRDQTKRERWYERGHQDGEAWAMERATVEQLRHVDELWEDAIAEGEDFEEGDVEGWEGELSSVVELDEPLERWEGSDALDEDWTLKRAYLRGWQVAVHDLWRAARSRLG